MKTLKLMTAFILMSVFVSEINAQGVKVYLTDGTIQTYPYQRIDSIVAYELSNEYVDYVDLGLSVKWATCNLGASSPEEYGNYYAWAETEPRTGNSWNYTWSTTPYYLSGDSYDNVKWSKYTGSDGKTVLDAEDDAAAIALGFPWRIPTLDEMNELLNNCTWTWTSMNGKTGYKVVASNGNSIFLPAAGWCVGASLYNTGSNGYYWSSSLDTSDPNYGYGLHFDSAERYWLVDYRYYGLCVRPVRQ